jgi:heme A synthase
MKTSDSAGSPSEITASRRDGSKPAGLRRWGWWTLGTAVAAWLLIVLGAVVRITGSGMGCGPDWPLCNGRVIPLMDLPTFIEWSHRMVAAGIGLMVAGVTASAWWPGRGEGWGSYRRLSAVALVLLVIQVLLGAVTVRLELPPASVILHKGTAMCLLAVLLVAATRALSGRRVRLPDGPARTGWTGAAGALVVVLFGAFVANLDAAPACQGFPLCNGSLFPGGGWRIQLHWAHRLSAYALVAWALYLPVWAGRVRPGDPAARRWAYTAAVLAVAQLAAGAAMVLEGLPGVLRAAHVATGGALFGSMVVLATVVARPPAGAASREESPARSPAPGERPAGSVP